MHSRTALASGLSASARHVLPNVKNLSQKRKRSENIILVTLFRRIAECFVVMRIDLPHFASCCISSILRHAFPHSIGIGDVCACTTCTAKPQKTVTKFFL